MSTFSSHKYQYAHIMSKLWFTHATFSTFILVVSLQAEGERRGWDEAYRSRSRGVGVALVSASGAPRGGQTRPAAPAALQVCAPPAGQLMVLHVRVLAQNALPGRSRAAEHRAPVRFELTQVTEPGGLPVTGLKRATRRQAPRPSHQDARWDRR